MGYPPMRKSFAFSSRVFPKASQIKTLRNHEIISQLQKYLANVDQTILILKTDNIALMNHSLLYKAFLQAAACISMPNIDQVWMASTIDNEEHCSFIGFDAPDSIMEKANLPQWMLGKRHAPYWWAEIEREKATQDQA